MFDVNKFEANSSNYLGVMVFWTIPETEVSHTELETKIKEVGLNPKALPKPSPKKALKRATIEVSGNNSRKIIDNGEKVVFGLLSERKNTEQEKVEISQTTTARLAKDGWMLRVEGNQSEKLQDAYKKHLRVVATSADIRSFINRTVDSMQGISLRKTGGIYFIPKAEIRKVAALEEVVQWFGGTLHILHQVDESAEREVTWASLEHEVEVKIEGILDSVANMKKSAKCARKQEGNLEAVKQMVASYKTICEDEARMERILETIQEASSAIASKIEVLA